MSIPKIPAFSRQRLKLCLLLALFCMLPAARAQDIDVTVDKRGNAFIIDAHFELAVPLRTAWEVLTDFEGMPRFLTNLISSKIVGRSGNTLIVQQEGKAKYGPISYAFASEREVKLEPMKRISVRQLSGTAKRFASQMDITPGKHETEFDYHAELVPDSGWALSFGSTLVHDEVEEQFAAMAAEMLRRIVK